MPGSRIHLWPPKVTSWDLLIGQCIYAIRDNFANSTSREKGCLLNAPRFLVRRPAETNLPYQLPHLVLHTRLVRAAFPHPIWHYLGKTNNSCQWTAVLSVTPGPFMLFHEIDVQFWYEKSIGFLKKSAEYLCKLALLLARCTRSHQKAQGCKWFPLCSCTCLPLWRTRMFLALHLKVGNCHAKLADSRSAEGSSTVVMVVNIIIHFLCTDH